MAEDSRVETRRSILLGFGADDGVLAELLDYNANTWGDTAFGEAPVLPLDDEVHLREWRDYVAEAEEAGVPEALGRRLVQLRFPIEQGVSASDRYRGVTLRGELPPAGGGPEFVDPEGLKFRLNATQAGTIPVLEIRDRADFETLVRALSHRNEPKPVPESMGACIISGLNNWDRIRAYKERWQQESGDTSGPGWDAEFKRLIPRKAEYQDRFILLSSGPYSAVSAADMGLAEDDWLAKSMIIRREHECTHYFTLRVLGMMRNNLIDELIADYVGLVHAFGRYEARAALLFLGLNRHPETVAGGRVENYRGDPPLSDDAFAIVKSLMVEAVRTLERFNANDPDRYVKPEAVAATILALASRTLEELAQPGADEFLIEAV